MIDLVPMLPNNNNSVRLSKPKKETIYKKHECNKILVMIRLQSGLSS